MTTIPQPGRYWHRPIEITALQWNPGSVIDAGRIVGALMGEGVNFRHPDGMGETTTLLIDTPEGEQIAQPGDWIVRADGDDWAVMAAADFAERYEPAVSSPPPDQTALRARLAEAMAKRDGHPWPTEFEDDERDYYRRADAALGVLPPADRADVYREVADRLAADAAQGAQEGWMRIYKRGAATKVREWADELAAEGPLSPYYEHPECGFHWHGRDGMDIPMRDGQPVCPRCELRRLAAEAQQQPETGTLAAMFEGLHHLLATSSRDWQTYRVDAWLWAVLCGWDCEQAEHTDTCTHGALEETAAMHGWDADTVAKARRYRAAVRALTKEA